MEVNLGCRICGNLAENKLHKVREMMFGYRDVVEYLECSRCGCLQIVEFPSDLQRYYPSEYGNSVPVKIQPSGCFRSNARRLLARSIVCGHGVFGSSLSRLYPRHPLWSLRKTGVSVSSRILDVGCASGSLLLKLWDAGFRNLLGVDPYIEKSIEYPCGLTIIKCPAEEVEGRWDLIMFHHSLEHIADPIAVLRHCAASLADGGSCLVRVPVAQSYAWRRYGVHWVQIDAPRHVFVYSVPTVEILAARTGLSLVEVVYDSTEFQFWASEQYLRDIPLRSHQSYWVNPEASVFSPTQIRDFRAQARRLNAERDGDQAVFYLRKAARA